MKDVHQLLLSLAVKWQAVGSQVTCRPAPTGSDFDYLVLIKPEQADLFCERMAIGGFEIELGAGYAASVLTQTFNEDVFNSYRCDDVNFIITSSPNFYTKFIAATCLAKRFNLLEKIDRIDLFQAVLYGNVPVASLPPLPPINN